MTNAVKDFLKINYERLMYAAFFTPFGEHASPKFAGEENWGPPMVFKGPPGTAKTAFVRQLAMMLMVYFYSFKPGSQGEGAFGVTPMPVTRIINGKETIVFEYPPPAWIADFGDDPGIVFFDEINTVNKTAQAPLLAAIQEKEVGSQHYGPRVRVFGAMNATDEAAGGSDLAPNLANRLCHVPWVPPPVSKWNSHMISKVKRYSSKQKQNGKARPFDVLAEEERVLGLFPQFYAKAVGQMTAFSEAFEDQWHHNQPKSTDPRSSEAWTSARSKDYATHALAASYLHDLDVDTRDAYVGGFVGEDFVAEFSAFVNKLDIPSAADFLDGKAKFKHNPNRTDRTAALLAECAASIVPEDAPKRDKRGQSLFEFFETIQDDSIDAVAAVVIGSLHEAGFTENSYARGIVKKLRRMLDLTESV